MQIKPFGECAVWELTARASAKQAVSGNGDTNCTAGEEQGNDSDWLESAECEWSQEHGDCVCG